MRTVIFDTGQRAKVNDNPYWITYQCAGCGEYRDDCEPHSQWNGEGWTKRRLCADCEARSV